MTFQVQPKVHRKIPLKKKRAKKKGFFGGGPWWVEDGRWYEFGSLCFNPFKTIDFTRNTPPKTCVRPCKLLFRNYFDQRLGHVTQNQVQKKNNFPKGWRGPESLWNSETWVWILSNSGFPYRFLLCLRLSCLCFFLWLLKKPQDKKEKKKSPKSYCLGNNHINSLQKAYVFEWMIFRKNPHVGGICVLVP